MDEREGPDKLTDLGARIDKAVAGRRVSGPKRQRGTNQASALSFGLRIGLELVVAVVLGVGLGLLLDRFLGTRPWGMVVCFFLGAAAGMVNVYRAATGLGMAAGYRQSGKPPPDGEWDED